MPGTTKPVPKHSLLKKPVSVLSLTQKPVSDIAVSAQPKLCLIQSMGYIKNTAPKAVKAVSDTAKGCVKTQPKTCVRHIWAGQRQSLWLCRWHNSTWLYHVELYSLTTDTAAKETAQLWGWDKCAKVPPFWAWPDSQGLRTGPWHPVRVARRPALGHRVGVRLKRWHFLNTWSGPDLGLYSLAVEAIRPQGSYPRPMTPPGFRYHGV